MKKLGIIKTKQEHIIAEKQSQPIVVGSQSTIAIKSTKTSKYDKLIGGNWTMTIFNKQGLKLTEEIKTNPE